MKFLAYQDIVEHLIAASYGGPQDAEQRDIRSAAQRAYREVATMRDWRFYHTHGRVMFQSPWRGTVTYDDDSRTLTRVDGDPFPLHSEGCSVRVLRAICLVQKRVSNTQLIVDEVLKLPNLLLAPTPATLYQGLYPLPEDFRNMDTPIDQFAWSYFTYVTPDEAMKIETAVDLQGPPHSWTVLKDPRGPGYAVKVLGYPQEVTSLDFTYRRSPRPMRISGHEPSSRQGTVTVAGTAVTGVGTAFATSMVGSVLRIGTASAVPDTFGSMNPYEDEAYITAVSSATSMTLATAMTASAVKYVITDVADMPDFMHNAMLSCGEYWLARMRGQKEDKVFAMFQRDLKLALENDGPVPLSGAPRMIYDNQGWRSQLRQDNSGVDGGPA
jgi:hypothetical protein